MPASNGSHPENATSSIKPGDDFYRYANDDWLKANTIPAGQSSYDNRALMAERTSVQVRDLIQNAASENGAKGSVLQKVGDYYASFVDQNGIEAKGLVAIADEMAKIAAISDRRSLSSYLGTTLNSEVEGLTANSDHVFGVWVNQGFEDADHNLPHIWQGGLGLPDRDNYLDSSSKMAEVRKRYQEHVEAVLRLAGVTDLESRAERILSLETRIAEAFAPDSEAADVSKQNNPWKRADFSSKAPGMDWEVYFQSAGLSDQRDFIVWQPSAVIGVSALVADENVEVWKDYLRFHFIK
jgi:predicted metalloendopeptidase